MTSALTTTLTAIINARVVPVNFLVHQASLAVQEGLPVQTTLEALTVNPAAILGLDSRVGPLTVGQSRWQIVGSRGRRYQRLRLGENANRRSMEE